MTFARTTLSKLVATACALVVGVSIVTPAISAAANAHGSRLQAPAVSAHRKHHHRGARPRIPQHNGGDRDGDNNGGPSDGDGNL